MVIGFLIFGYLLIAAGVLVFVHGATRAPYPRAPRTPRTQQRRTP